MTLSIKQIQEQMKLAAEFQDLSPRNFEYSTEGLISSLGEYFSVAQNYIKQSIRKVLNLEVRFESDAPVPKGDIEQLFVNYEWSQLRKLRAFGPSKMNGLVSEHIEVLTEAFEKVNTIEERLLDPLNKYLAEVISDPEDLTKFWNDSKIDEVDIDHYMSRLSKSFKAENTTAEPHVSTYGKLYANKRDVLEQPERLKKLRELARSIDIDVIIKKEESLSERIDDLMEILNETSFTPDSKTVAKLANHVDAASREMEFLSVIMYYAKLNIHAFNEGYEYNVEMLKDK